MPPGEPVSPSIRAAPRSKKGKVDATRSASPGAPRPASRKEPRRSPHGSPSMLGLSPISGPDAAELPPAFELPTAAFTGAAPANPKTMPRAPVPERPPSFDSEALIGSQSGIGPHEAYSRDEKALNEFLKLHPMLSMEATSQRTLQMLSGMFEKASIMSGDLPVIGKSYDDQFLRPASEAIGERPCINGCGCLAQFVAKMRYGPDTKMAFTCTEFLLPEAREDFLNGRGLPSRRGKCLMCMRYFQNYVYILARTDPAFKVGESPLGMQVFANAITEIPGASNDDAQLREASKELPTHASIVSAADGYKPSAMLFVDEDWVNMRSAREGGLGKLLWRPVLRFSSSHYNYVIDEDGPRIVQVGVGTDDNMDGLHFGQLPARMAAAPGARAGPRQ